MKKQTLIILSLFLLLSTSVFASWFSDDEVILYNPSLKSSDLDVLCSVDSSFLYRFGGLWGCGQLNASQMNVTIMYNMTNITIYELNESDPLSLHLTGGDMSGDINLNNHSIYNISSINPSIDDDIPPYVEGGRFYVNGNTKKWCQWIHSPDVYACDGADWRRMVNKDVVVIPSCTAVSPLGSQGQRMGVTRASASFDNVSDVIGVTMHSCNVGGECWVMFKGTIRGQCDTTSWSVGDHLYLNTSVNGSLINSQVSLFNYNIHVGDVLTSEANGQVNVDIKEEWNNRPVFNNFAVRNDTYINGKVGISTSSPSSNLHIVDNDYNSTIVKLESSLSGTLEQGFHDAPEAGLVFPFIKGYDVNSNINALELDTGAVFVHQTQLNDDNALNPYISITNLDYSEGATFELLNSALYISTFNARGVSFAENVTILNNQHLIVGGTGTFNGNVNINKDQARLSLTDDGGVIFSMTNTGAGIDIQSSQATVDLRFCRTVACNLVFDTNTLYANASSNRVGIGTASPSYPLHVVGDAGATRMLSGSFVSSSNGNTGLFFDANLNAYIQTIAPRNISFKTSQTDRMIIDSNGSIGMGIMSPVTRLELPFSKTGINNSKFGSYELQSYDINNAWLAENAYYNGSAFIYRGTGGTSLLRFLSDSFYLQSSATGTAGGIVSPVTVFSTKYNSGFPTFRVGVETTTNTGTYNKFVVSTGTYDSLATSQLNSLSANTKPLVVQGYASQNANLQEWQNSNGTALVSVSADGDLNISNNTHIYGDLIVHGNVSMKRPYATFSSTQTQTIASANTAYPVTFNYTDDSYLISIINETNITFSVSGDYQIGISAIVSSSVANKHVDIWFRKNGVDIPRSNTHLEIANVNAEYVIAVPLIHDFNTTDNLQVMWGSDSTGMQMLYTPNSSYAPESPSIIMTVGKWSEITND